MNGISTVMEAMACPPLSVDPVSGEMEFVIVGSGTRAQIAACFQPGDAISVMGPTGIRTRMPAQNQNVLLIADRDRIAQTLATARQYKALACHVDICVTVNSANDLYFREALEAASDRIVWVFQEGEALTDLRADDWCEVDVGLASVCSNALFQDARTQKRYDLGMVLGSAELCKLIQKSRQTEWKTHFDTGMKWVASLYGPMQCMLKGVCAQCLQWQVDPVTGVRTKAVYACSWQDEPMDIVDYDHLLSRNALGQVVGALNAHWLKYSMRTHQEMANG